MTEKINENVEVSLSETQEQTQSCVSDTKLNVRFEELLWEELNATGKMAKKNTVSSANRPSFNQKGKVKAGEISPISVTAEEFYSKSGYTNNESEERIFDVLSKSLTVSKPHKPLARVFLNNDTYKDLNTSVNEGSIKESSNKLKTKTFWKTEGKLFAIEKQSVETASQQEEHITSTITISPNMEWSIFECSLNNMLSPPRISTLKMSPPKFQKRYDKGDGVSKELFTSPLSDKQVIRRKCPH